jgi:hypothetical protein
LPRNPLTFGYGISQRLPYILLALPSGYPITFERFPSGYWIKLNNFFPKAAYLQMLTIKIEDTQDNFKKP